MSTELILTLGVLITIFVIFGLLVWRLAQWVAAHWVPIAIFGVVILVLGVSFGALIFGGDDGFGNAFGVLIMGALIGVAFRIFKH